MLISVSMKLNQTAGIRSWHRYSHDNVSWGSWTLYGTDNAPSWSWSFDPPAGDGYYEFYSVAVDWAGNLEPAPDVADAGAFVAVGLVGYWSFDENEGNVAHNRVPGVDGTIYGATWTGGRVGSALSFDGDDYVEFPATVYGETPELTAVFWVRARFSDMERAIMAKAWAPNIPGVWLASGGIGSNISFTVITEQGRKTLYSNSVLDNDWTHVALRYDGENVKIYLNGIEDASGSQSGMLSPTPDSFFVGRSGRDTTNMWIGDVDEVRIYTRALSPEEVLEQYLGGIALSYDEIASTLPEQLPDFTETLTNSSFAGGTQFTCTYDSSTNTVEWEAPDFSLSANYYTSEITLQTPTISGSWSAEDGEDEGIDYTAIVSVVPPFVGEGSAYASDSKGETYKGSCWGIWNVYTPLTLLVGDQGTTYVELEVGEISEKGFSAQASNNSYTGDWETRGKASLGIPLVAAIGGSLGAFSEGDGSAYGLSLDVDGTLFGTVTGTHVLNIDVKPIADGVVTVGEAIYNGGVYMAEKIGDAVNWAGEKVGELWDAVTGLFSSPPLPLTEEVHAARENITNDLVLKLYTILTTTPVKARDTALELAEHLKAAVADEDIREELDEATTALEKTIGDFDNIWRVRSISLFDKIDEALESIGDAIEEAEEDGLTVVDNLTTIREKLIDVKGLLAGDIIYDMKAAVGFTNEVTLADEAFDNRDYRTAYIYALFAPSLEKSRELKSSVENLNVNQGVKTSLLSKIKASIQKEEKALSSAINEKDETEEMLEASANILNAFNNHVNALAGKKITNDDANVLIQLAQEQIQSIEGLETVIAPNPEDDGNGLD